MMYANGFGRGFGCFGPYGGSFWGMGITLVVIAVAIYLVIKLVNRNSHSSSALDILKMKYVNGEITEEEYIQRKNVLKK